MQTVAPAGGVAISEETCRLVWGYFELRELGPTEIKGVADPVNVYQVTGIGYFCPIPQRGRLGDTVGSLRGVNY